MEACSDIPASLVGKTVKKKGDIDSSVDKVRTLKLLVQDVQAGIKKKVEVLEFATAECSHKEFISLLIAESVCRGPQVREAWF